MIPRRIHYCWFSGEPFPQPVEKCIASWHEHMPDYEYVLWDLSRIRDEFGLSSENYPSWLKETLDAGKWAFAADFVRVYAIYKYGGIYLDTDCMVYASLDRFLSHRFFIGREDSPRVTHFFYVEVWLSSHCFGGEPYHPYLKQNLDYYKGRHFVQCDAPQLSTFLRFDMRLLPEIQARIAMAYGYDISAYAEEIQRIEAGITIYPSIYFGKSGRKVTQKPDLYVNHLCLGGWIDEHRKERTLEINWFFKIRWRLLYVIKRFASRFHYVVFEYT